jgi:UDP-N-acetylmuramate dehydrogenase
MKIQNHTSLKPYNTFGIDVSAAQFCSVTTIPELKEALELFHEQEILVLGGGSNMLLRSDFENPVVHVNLKGIDIIKKYDNTVFVRVMSGENWHDFVLWCLEHHYGGVENLSLIPGNVGTAPIQNIGAYGVELKDVFVSCEAMDRDTRQIKEFTKKDCEFGYRDSVFKGKLKNKYVISSVTFQLTTTKHQINTDYGAIQAELTSKGISNPTIQDVSNAVIAIRRSKLPDPNELGNSGSFFKNPVVSRDHYDTLIKQFPSMPSYKISDEVYKVPAGWLIETAGFKGKRFGNYGIHEKQALVLVNYGDASGKDIYNLAVLIRKTVKRLFQITLEMEVNII